MNMFKKLSAVGMAVFILWPAVHAQSSNLKIGIINMQIVINESKKGKKIKKLIEVEVLQTKKALTKKKQEIDAIYAELQTSLILSAEAKVQKQKRAQQLIQQLQSEQKKQEGKFRKKERKKTEELIIEINTIITRYAKKNGYDFIVEAQVAAAILFSKYPFDDVTERIIKLYNIQK